MSPKPAPPPTQLRVLIVRHGETRENVERIIQGQLDTDLNERGRQQAALTGHFLAPVHIDRIITSPLRRAADTAKAICAHQSSSRPELEYDDRLKERAFGVLQGKVYTGGATKSEDTEGIERMQPFSERLASFWNDLVTREGKATGEKTETVVLVSHGAAISALMNQVLVPGRYCIVPPTVVPSRFWNCSITELLVPVISTSAADASTTVSPGDLSRKQHWSVRPIHLGVQGSQFVLDHELQKKLLERAKSSATTTDAVDQLQALVDKTESEFQRDPQGRAQLEADTIKAPDGSTVENDIGYGKAIGVVEQWSNVDHLKELEAPPTPASSNGASNVNVDELVK
ncbi:hypothetical protein EX895_004990 [Sporisorium graminicola]|uniref:Phosphoglycerate mutase-like protein n=1 Tax=Sporisorium graminicola TaxID=280036 RepID=A0A4U7KNV4_9BASI|nr:hypothetical protein EX895_004990 [Sporisorium graminicola]TKY86165.1 hypothetical protein EX895_004990 [Sporisorium graminicola]